MVKCAEFHVTSKRRVQPLHGVSPGSLQEYAWMSYAQDTKISASGWASLSTLISCTENTIRPLKDSSQVLGPSMFRSSLAWEESSSGCHFSES